MTRNPMLSETLAETLHGQARHNALPVPPRRRLLAGLTAGALALSVVFAQATPVRAGDNDDLLAALAALAVIGVIVGAADNDRHPAPTYLPPPPPPPPLSYHPRPTHPRPTHPRPTHPRPPHPHPSHAVMLPAVCAIEVGTRDRGDVVFYTESCLDRAGVRRLPDRCARKISFQGRHEWVYGQHCLREAGYRFQNPLRRDYERPD